MLSKVLKYFYQPSIKFPDRKGVEGSLSMLHIPEPVLSGQKVKMTNREALNHAMDEEIKRNPKVFLIGE